MTTNQEWTLSVAIACGALIACGGNGAGSSGPFRSGLPQDEIGSKLNDSDKQRLCDALKSYYSTNNAFETASCKLAGAIAAGFAFLFQPTGGDPALRKSCSDARDSCLRSPLMPDGGVGFVCNRPGSECSATVGEIETCINDSVMTAEDLAARLPECEKLSAKDLSSSSSDAGSTMTTSAMPVSPPACGAVQAKCPSALGPPQ